MTTNKKIKSKLKLMLRSMGFLCNKNSKPKKIKIRISRSINVDGTVTEYTSPLERIPVNEFSLQSEITVFLADKKIARPECKFNIETQNCECGHSVNDFLLTPCNTKK
jgi:hypothetical protein